MTRRQFSSLITGAAAWYTPVAHMYLSEPEALTMNPISALVFDAFVIFDPSNVLHELEATFPGKGSALFGEWRTRQFEYSWLRTLTGRYADFWQVTDEALVWSTNKLGLTLSPQQRSHLMAQYLRMNTWPETRAILSALKEMELRLALLSNLTKMMLEKNLEHTLLKSFFEQWISTDDAQLFKPHPRAYQLGLDRLAISKPEVLFVAFAGWDAAGAKQFGYPTYWVNRLRLPVEELGIQADAVGGDLKELLAFVSRRDRHS